MSIIKKKDGGTLGFPGGISGKEATNAEDLRDTGLIPGLGRSPGGGHGNPLQYSCLENPMERGAWRAIVHRVSKSWTWLERLGMHAPSEGVWEWVAFLIKPPCLSPAQKPPHALTTKALPQDLCTSSSVSHSFPLCPVCSSLQSVLCSDSVSSEKTF